MKGPRTIFVNRRITKGNIETIAAFPSTESRLMSNYINHLNDTRNDAHYYMAHAPSKKWTGQTPDEFKTYTYRGVKYQVA